MGGQDKGLLPWQGQPMAWRVAQSLAPQVRTVCVNANRHLDQYGQWPWPVVPDDADLPQAFGPLSGILTGLRHTLADWLQVVPCDTPMLPPNLVERLMAQALTQGVDIAVPMSSQVHAEAERHHWTAALIRRTLLPSLEQAVSAGHPRVRDWVTQARWTSVSFGQTDAFKNFNHPGDMA